MADDVAAIGQMDAEDGRVPTAPGSHPSGHAASGVDDASRFDPSREETPWLHLRGQFSYHGEALISGSVAGLTALRDALTAAIEQRDAVASVYANDGEGYVVTIRRCARLRDMGQPPYIDELARAVADTERQFMKRHEKYNRDLWRDRWDQFRRDSDGSPQGGDAEGGSVHDSAGPEDIAR